VNNLNLEVRIGDVLHYGNAMYSGNVGYQVYLVPDSINNVEQVSEYITQPTTLSVKVIGYNVPVSPQPYSLVVVYEGLTLTKSSTCAECEANYQEVCPIENGLGLRKCQSNNMFGPCLVTSCDEGFTFNSNENSCVVFLAYNLVITVVCACCAGLMLFTTLLLWFCLQPANCFRKDKDGNDVQTRPIPLGLKSTL
jgi:hypothetical protein